MFLSVKVKMLPLNKHEFRLGSQVTARATDGILINENPTEEVGRDTLSRYDMQFQAAAFATLEILEGKGVVCVYCDFHDDFVVKSEIGGVVTYHFYQVKTKGKLNHQWTLLEVLAIKKRGQTTEVEALKKVRLSFLGKLLEHGVRFGESCAAVTLLSNVHFEDDVVNLVEEWKKRKKESKTSNLMIDNFQGIFTVAPAWNEVATQNTLAKLSLYPAVGHIGLDREQFINSSRTAIYKYSEIDLDFFEITDLANNLLDVVYQRSKGALANVDLKNIGSRVGVVLDDMLKVLSISPSAYRALLGGVDDKIIKTASILQRVLKASGASPSMIEFASVQKVAWDVWFRNARHTYSDLDLELLLQRLDDTHREWRKRGGTFEDLQNIVDQFLIIPAVAKMASLNKELVFGGILAALVRSFTK
jgi:hypothetical protein